MNGKALELRYLPLPLRHYIRQHLQLLGDSGSAPRRLSLALCFTAGRGGSSCGVSASGSVVGGVPASFSGPAYFKGSSLGLTAVFVSDLFSVSIDATFGSISICGKDCLITASDRGFLASLSDIAYGSSSGS